MVEFDYNYERCADHKNDINNIGDKLRDTKKIFHDLDKRVVKIETNFKIMIGLQVSTFTAIILHFIKDLF